jgi:hypothetical protein
LQVDTGKIVESSQNLNKQAMCQHLPLKLSRLVADSEGGNRLAFEEPG